MIEVFTFSEAGGHVENEDAHEILPLDPIEGLYLCAIADGQGGRAGGGPAARLACRASLDIARSLPLTQLLTPRCWIDILKQADEAVSKDPLAGFTTLIAFCVTPYVICGAANGDSSAILLQADQTTTDLTAQQWKNPPVGSGTAHFVSFGASLKVPWSVLAMTDGVWKYVGLSTVLQIAQEKKGRDLIAEVRNRAGLKKTGALQDDFTLIVLEGIADLLHPSR